MQGKNFWLPFLTKYQNGRLLIDAVKNADQFIRYPVLTAEDIKAEELPGVTSLEEPLLAALSPKWDVVILDETTRKLLFVTAASAFGELQKSELLSEHRVGAEQALAAYYPSENTTSWFQEYGGFTEMVLFIRLLNDPRYGCLARGWRGEMVLLELADDPTVAEAVSNAAWLDFNKTWEPRILRNVFFAPFALS